MSAASHLLQMRGLKHPRFRHRPDRDQSHLLQMRGLKLIYLLILLIAFWVASFTDAWIETH